LWNIFKNIIPSTYHGDHWDPYINIGLVPNNTFSGCTGIIKGITNDISGDFTVPEGIYFYGSGCFANLAGITGTITLPVWCD
jgi:hypothetical protein